MINRHWKSTILWLLILILTLLFVAFMRDAYADGWKASFVAHHYSTLSEEYAADIAKRLAFGEAKLSLRQVNEVEHYNLQIVGAGWGLKFQSGNYIGDAHQTFAIDWPGRKPTTYATPASQLFHAFVKQDIGILGIQADYMIRDSLIAEWEVKVEATF